MTVAGVPALLSPSAAVDSDGLVSDAGAFLKRSIVAYSTYYT